MKVILIDDERLARTVALKVMRTQSSAEVLERFKREAKALARVNSPYVAEALDADVLSDGSPFLVMELLQGRDLRMELRQRGPLARPSLTWCRAAGAWPLHTARASCIVI